MKFYSTEKNSPNVGLREAVLKGLASDRGLFMPTQIPLLTDDFLTALRGRSFQEVSFEVARSLLASEIDDGVLKKMIDSALDFEVPLVEVELDVYSLELFHGPSLAFKDFGARFMAALMSYFVQGRDSKLTILVATSGDTGSAVAQGFYKSPGIDVVILYPSGKVSPLQEKQLTTLGHNIRTVEVDGVFDDCQKLVKEAFLDRELALKLTLSSANSINIARLIPQSFYYFYAFSKLGHKGPLVFSVPSGNFGNLTAGLIAHKMGLPVEHFIASTNINDVVPEYLESGIFAPRASTQTISNAMDVGNPSNFARISELYGHNHQCICDDISGVRFTDKETRATMKRMWDMSNYVLDPHGAVAYLGLKDYLKNHPEPCQGVFLETAHPAKFLDVVEESIGISVKIPPRLAVCLKKKKRAVKISKTFSEFKEYLLASG